MINRLSRREFLKMVGACSCAAGMHGLMRGSGVLAYAMVPSSRVGFILVINFAGGFDGYYLLQSNDPLFRALRPTLALPDAEQINFGHPVARLHSNAPNLSQLTQAGEIAWYHNVGLVYPNGPDTGHDSATAHMFEQNAASSNMAGNSFIANIVNQAVFQQNGLAAVSTGPGSILAGTYNGQAFGDLDSFGTTENDWWGGKNDTAFRTMISASVRQSLTNELLPNSNQRRMVATLRSKDNTIETLKDALEGIPAGQYPQTGFGRIFRDAARLAKLPESLGIGICFAQDGGYDSHADQADDIDDKITALDEALALFRTDMGSLWSRTAVVIMSEFGRTAKENRSRGTDHGYGNPIFVAGGAINGGLKDEPLAGAELQPSSNWFGVRHNIQNILATIFLGLNPGIDVQAAFPGINPAELGYYSGLLR